MIYLLSQHDEISCYWSVVLLKRMMSLHAEVSKGILNKTFSLKKFLIYIVNYGLISAFTLYKFIEKKVKV